jgi:NTE family protein
MFGQPGFFTPREPHDWFSSNKSTSALKSILEFDRINHAKEMRLSVGAVNVRTGHFDYFNSEKITIRPAEDFDIAAAVPFSAKHH